MVENASTIVAVLQIAARAVAAIRVVFTMVDIVPAALRLDSAVALWYVWWWVVIVHHVPRVLSVKNGRGGRRLVS